MSKPNEKLPYSFIQASAMLLIAMMSEGVLMLESINLNQFYPLGDFVPKSVYIQSYVVLICNTIIFFISLILYFYAFTIKPPDARKKLKIKKAMNANFMLVMISFLTRTSLIGVYPSEGNQVLSNYVSCCGALNVAFSSLHMYLNRSINTVNAGYNALKKNDSYDEEDLQKNSPEFMDSFAMSPSSYGHNDKHT